MRFSPSLSPGRRGKDMHILMLPSWYPSERDAINGCFFREQAEALAKSGIRVSVFPYYADRKRGVCVERTERAERMTEYGIHYAVLPLHLTYLRLVGTMAGLIRSMSAENRPDVIHVHSFQAARYALALKKLFGIPVVITEHATWFERGLLSEKTLADVRRFYAGADALIAVSPGLKEVIAPYYPGEISVIPNMVSDFFFSQQRLTSPPPPFRFAAVGSMQSKKGIDVLLNAFAGVVESGADVLLTVCGGGQELEVYQRLARDLALEDRVSFTGQISREACAEVLASSHAFVLPSRSETFGVVYAEAMACGLPIIMTKTNAWRELVTAETGLAVEIEDISGLQASMIDLMNRYGEYDGAFIRERCRSRYSGDSVCAQLKKIYGSAAARDVSR